MAADGRSLGAIGAVHYKQRKGSAEQISPTKVAPQKNPKQITYLGLGSLLPQSFCGWAAVVEVWGAAQLGPIMAASSRVPGMFQCPATPHPSVFDNWSEGKKPRAVSAKAFNECGPQSSKAVN